LVALFLYGSTVPSIEAQGIRPDFAATQAYAAALQNDHSVRGTAALLDRLDTLTISEIAGSGFGINKADEEIFMAQIAASIGKTLKGEMELLNSLPIFQMSRILAIRGKRVLECIFLNETGGYRIFYFTLRESSPGVIKMVDFSALGFPRNFTTSLRARLLLAGSPTYKALTGEELQLEQLLRGHTLKGGAIFVAMGKNDFDQAFRHLDSLPPEIRTLHVWRETRNRLMWQGSKLAKADFAAEVAQGARFEDDFDRYVQISHGGDPRATLEALERVIWSAHQIPFLRLQKTEALIELRQLDEASRIAEHLRELNPLLISAHLAVIRLAVMRKDESLAFECLERALHICQLDTLIRFLEQDPKASSWLSSPEFKEWQSRPREYQSVGDLRQKQVP